MIEWMRQNDLAVALLILGAALLAAIVVRLIWGRVVTRAAIRYTPLLGAKALNPVRDLVSGGLILAGLHSAAASWAAGSGRADLSGLINQAAAIGWAVLITVAVIRTANAIVDAYIRNSAEDPHAAEKRTMATVVRKTVSILALAIAVLTILRATGVDVAPLLAGGAVGGVAAALALQDTLANVFAGYTIAVDRPIRVGDFVALEGGFEGFVTEIGWRNTKMRTWANNLVVVPNSKLAGSILTNHSMPQSQTNVNVFCGVSYDSDLEHVERVAHDVAATLQRDTPGALPDWEPVVRWKEFADSAVTFVVVLRAAEFESIYLLQSECVKALHRRFREEGIEIPFPIRTLIMKPTEDSTAPRAPLPA